MAGEELIELKFRLFDGTDIGPNKYDPATTIGSLKEVIVNRWPQGFELREGIYDQPKECCQVPRICSGAHCLAIHTIDLIGDCHGCPCGD